MNHTSSTADAAAVYRRVSTDHQDGSLALQEKRVNEYALFKHLDLREGYTFSDPDTSGRIPIVEREGGRALINRLKHGDLKHLVVAKLDRIGRNAKDALGFLEFLTAQGVTLHITDLGGETISTQGHMGKFILGILLCVAEWEASEIRDRTTKIMRGKFDRHELTGNVPFGWWAEYIFPDAHSHCSPTALNPSQIEALGHGEPMHKKLTDHEEEQEMIRQLWTWRQQPDGERLDTSYTKVAEYANAKGWRTKQDKPWTCGNVSSVLNNRHTQRLLQTSAPAEPVSTASLP